MLEQHRTVCATDEARRLGRLRRRGTPLLLIGLLALAAASACDRSSSVGRPHSEGPSATASSASSGPLQFVVGKRRDYALALSSKAQLGTGTKLADLTLEGSLQITPLSGGADSPAAALHAVVAAAKLTSSDAEPRVFEAVARELQDGFLVELDGGAVRAVRMAATSSVFAASLARTVASHLQLSGGRFDKPAREQDVTGEYEVEYRPTSANRYTKRKLRYEPLKVQSAAVDGMTLTLKPEILSSEGRLQLEAGELVGLTYAEKLKTQLLGSGDAFSETSLSLHFSGQSSAKTLSLADLRARTVDLGTLTPEAMPREATNLDRAAIADFTFDTALATLDALNNGPLPLLIEEGEKESESARKQREQRLALHNKAFAALSAILRTRSESVPRAVSQVRSGGHKRAFVLDVLAGAGTVDTQAALVELAQAPELAEELRLRAAKGVSRAHHPSPGTIQALSRWLDDPVLGVYATYGIGTMARQLRARGNTDLAAEASRRLGERLAHSRDVEQQVHLLRGIANSGDAGLLAQVKPLLSHNNSSIRGAAVEALRLMDHPDVDDLIAQRLEAERNAVTLLAALNAAKPRRPSGRLVAALNQIARHGKGEQARQRSVTLMASWLPKQPELRSVLVELSEHDDSEEVRRIAKQALESTT